MSNSLPARACRSSTFCVITTNCFPLLSQHCSKCAKARCAYGYITLYLLKHYSHVVRLLCQNQLTSVVIELPYKARIAIESTWKSMNMRDAERNNQPEVASEVASYLRQKPPAPRNVGMPDSAEMPAPKRTLRGNELSFVLLPVSATICFACCRSFLNVAISLLGRDMMS